MVAVVLFVGVTAYAVFGGADFGAGFWDLTAGGAQRGARLRGLAHRSMGPVWEANHVWLIVVLVIVGLYAVVSVVLVMVLRAMSRRFRAAGLEEHEVPYGPRGPLEPPPVEEGEKVPS